MYCGLEMKFGLKLYSMIIFCILCGCNKAVTDRDCDPNKIYLNLFKVHITNNEYQESVVKFLSEKGFLYVEKIISMDQDYERVKSRRFHSRQFPAGRSSPYNVSRRLSPTEKEFFYGYSNGRYRRRLMSQKDVIIGVLDNGFQMNHTNLFNAINEFHSYDFYHNDPDPWHAVVPQKIRYEYEELFREVSHGTMCMGIIASEGLMHCGKGFGKANRIKITGLQVLNTKVLSHTFFETIQSPDTAEAKAFNYRLDEIEIVSASYGMADNKGFIEIGEASKEALRLGVKQGRNGKGRIYVFPAGNGKEDNCNMDGYAKSIYTLTIAGVKSNLQLPEYDERCPCILAAAPVNERFNTTAIFDTCINGFEGSSAAVPIASAHIANMLLENPNLTKRDVEHIIIESATQEGFDNSVKWNTNAAGYKYNDRLGFGLLNPSKMFKLAETWQQKPESITCKEDETDIIYIGSSCNIRFLEHVEISIEMHCQSCSITYFGSLNISMKSPMGTISSLLTESKIEKLTQIEPISTMLMTYEFWGETPQGNWNVYWTSRDHQRHIQLVVKKIILYGTPFDSITTTGEPAQRQTTEKKKRPDNGGVSRGRAVYLIFVVLVSIFVFVFYNLFL